MVPGHKTSLSDSLFLSGHIHPDTRQHRNFCSAETSSLYKKTKPGSQDFVTRMDHIKKINKWMDGPYRPLLFLNVRLVFES